MIFALDDELIFPPVHLANPDGLLCVGRDLSIERLKLAYSSGLFPWMDDPLLWYSPDPRMIVDLETYKPSKTLLRRLKSQKFKITCDLAFSQVISKCSSTREETWITHDFIAAYTELHQEGIAHSFECWLDDKLVGGLYGLSLGSAFFGESMFHTETDASKVAFSYMAFQIKKWGFTLLDCQVPNPHLVSLGCSELSREAYLQRLNKALNDSPKTGKWQANFDIKNEL